MRKFLVNSGLAIQALVYLGGIVGVIVSAELKSASFSQDYGRLPNSMICVTEDQVGLCVWEGKFRIVLPE